MMAIKIGREGTMTTERGVVPVSEREDRGVADLGGVAPEETVSCMIYLESREPRNFCKLIF